MRKLVLIGYREWALNLFDTITDNSDWIVLKTIRSKEQWDQQAEYLAQIADVFLFVGWSWLVDDNILSRVRCIGMHPSDLPEYRGGSPLQHQIIDGLEETKCTLMEFSQGTFDEGPILIKSNVSLKGDSMKEVLINISQTTRDLILTIMSNYNSIEAIDQSLDAGFTRKRRSQSDGRMNQVPLSKIQLKSMYNKMRSLTEPYPNAYFEDEDGNKVLITGIKWQDSNNVNTKL